MSEMSANSARNAPRAARRDPAPSRLAYRMQRLLLTPVFRSFLRIGLPMIAAAGLGAFVLGDRDTRDMIRVEFTELRRAVEERPEFMVQLMAIEGASGELDGDIRDILPIDFPISSFDLELEALRDEVAALDAVATVNIRIRSGGILQIDVSERVPAVVWRGPQGVELLDHEGHRTSALLARVERPDLPLLAGEGAELAVPEALLLIETARPLANRLRGLVRRGERRWDLILDRDQIIMLPEQNPVVALERVIALDQAQDMLARDLITVDMRNADRPTVRMTEPALLELRRMRGVDLGDPSL